MKIQIISRASFIKRHGKKSFFGISFKTWETLFGKTFNVKRVCCGCPSVKGWNIPSSCYSILVYKLLDSSMNSVAADFIGGRSLHYEIGKVTSAPSPDAPIFCYRSMRDLRSAGWFLDEWSNIVLCEAKEFTKLDRLNDSIKSIIKKDDCCKKVIFCKWVKPIEKVKI